MATETQVMAEHAEMASTLSLKIDLPGLKPDELEINVDCGMLTVSGSHTEGHGEPERQYVFARSIRSLPDDVDPKRIEASRKDGVVELTIPFTQAERNGR